jgi:hypothetical protein
MRSHRSANSTMTVPPFQRRRGAVPGVGPAQRRATRLPPHEFARNVEYVSTRMCLVRLRTRRSRDRRQERVGLGYESPPTRWAGTHRVRHRLRRQPLAPPDVGRTLWPRTASVSTPTVVSGVVGRHDQRLRAHPQRVARCSSGSISTGHASRQCSGVPTGARSSCSSRAGVGPRVSTTRSRPEPYRCSSSRLPHRASAGRGGENCRACLEQDSGTLRLPGSPGT